MGKFAPTKRHALGIYSIKSFKSDQNAADAQQHISQGQPGLNQNGSKRIEECDNVQTMSAMHSQQPSQHSKQRKHDSMPSEYQKSVWGFWPNGTTAGQT